MLAGVSTACFYPALTETAMQRVAARKIDITEVFFNSPSELTVDFVRMLAKTASEGGVRVLSVHPFTSGSEPYLLFSEYRRRTEDGFDWYKRYFEAANLLGARWIVMHGARRDYPAGRLCYFDRYGELDRLARQAGVALAQENVPRCIGWCPDFFAEMAAYLPDAQFLLDVKQSIRAGFAPLELARGMGKGLCHLHLSDHTPTADCLPIGAGELDVVGLLHTLRIENKFDGGVLLEVYRDNYQDDSELFESCSRIEAAIQTVACLTAKEE